MTRITTWEQPGRRRHQPARPARPKTRKSPTRGRTRRRGRRGPGFTSGLVHGLVGKRVRYRLGHAAGTRLRKRIARRRPQPTGQRKRPPRPPQAPSKRPPSPARPRGPRRPTIPPMPAGWEPDRSDAHRALYPQLTDRARWTAWAREHWTGPLDNNGDPQPPDWPTRKWAPQKHNPSTTPQEAPVSTTVNPAAPSSTPTGSNGAGSGGPSHGGGSTHGGGMGGGDVRAFMTDQSATDAEHLEKVATIASGLDGLADAAEEYASNCAAQGMDDSAMEAFRRGCELLREASQAFGEAPGQFEATYGGIRETAAAGTTIVGENGPVTYWTGDGR